MTSTFVPGKKCIEIIYLFYIAWEERSKTYHEFSGTKEDNNKPNKYVISIVQIKIIILPIYFLHRENR